MSVGLSRRAFLASAASLAGTGWATVLAPRAAAVAALATPEKLTLRRSAFAPLLGQTFGIAHDRGSLTVRLREISDLTPTIRAGAEDQFSLIFSGPRLGRGLPQGTYSISHPRRGQMSLFLVPVGSRRAAQQYQAIVNSPRQPRVH